MWYKKWVTHKKKAAHCGCRIVAIIFDEASLAELTNGQLPFLTRLPALKGFNDYIYSSNFSFSISFRVGITVHSLVLKGRAWTFGFLYSCARSSFSKRWWAAKVHLPIVQYLLYFHLSAVHNALLPPFGNSLKLRGGCLDPSARGSKAALCGGRISTAVTMKCRCAIVCCSTAIFWQLKRIGG